MTHLMYSNFWRRLKPLVLILGVCACWRSTTAADALSGPAGADAAPVPTISRFQQWWDMPEELRSRRYPYRLELRLHYADPDWRVLIVSDGFVDTFVHQATASPRLRSGQRVLIEGEVVPAEGLRLDEAKITILSDSDLVAMASTTGEVGNVTKFNCRYVEMSGYVNRQVEVDVNHVQLDLIAEGQLVMTQVLIKENRPIPQLEGALVRLTGVYSGVADPTSTAPRLELWVPSEQEIEVQGWLSHDPRFAQPPVSIGQLENNPTRELVLVRGHLHSQKNGEKMVLRDETGEITVRTAQRLSLERGAMVEAIGYASTTGIATELREALFRPAVGDGGNPAQPSGLPLLRLVDQVRELSIGQAQEAYPVRLQGVVTWSSPQARTFYLMDSSGGVAVRLANPATPPPSVGLRVTAHGHTAVGDFASCASAESVTLGDRVTMPEARAVSFEHAMTGVEEGQYIVLGGYVRNIAPAGASARLELATAGGEFVALVPRDGKVASLLGAVVRVRGVSVAQTDAQRQLTGIQLWVAGPDDVIVDEPSPPNPFDIPARSIVGLRQFSTLNSLNHRVRVAGTVLDHVPGSSLALADGADGLLVLSRETTPLQRGDRVEAVGLPGRQRDRVVLREAVYRRIGHDGEPAPLTPTGPVPIAPDLEGRLVRLEGGLLDLSASAAGMRFVCQSGGVVFEAPLRTEQAVAGAGWEPGSRLALTGVYHLQYDDYGRPRSVELQLRSASDVTVLRRAPWLTANRAIFIGCGLMGVVLLGLLWVNALRHRVRRQTEQIRVQLENAARLETELMRSSKLESLSVLAGGIAHDFNNLLTVVMGNMSLVLSGKPLDREAQQFLRESERAAGRARDLTQQLLTFSRGGAPVQMAVALPDIVRESAGFALHGSKSRCEFSIARDLWPANADKGQIAQVIHNLVINAIQAMPNGGIVRITLDNARLASGAKPALPAGRYVRASVADGGAGISPEHLSQVFDPYFSTKERGHGLGLATVYSILKKHGGQIEVSSIVGQGTTFVLWLPAAERVVDELPPAAPTAVRWRGRVLVMDDEEPIRRFLRALLERLGCEVIAVADGAAAVAEYAAARAAGQPFGLVILDLTIPAGMGGADAMARLRELDPGVRAIVSSGYSKDPVMARCRDFGFLGRVPKPYVFSELVNSINEVMQSAAACDPQEGLKRDPLSLGVAGTPGAES